MKSGDPFEKNEHENKVFELTDFPPELIQHILSYVIGTYDFSTIASLRLLCKILNDNVLVIANISHQRQLNLERDHIEKIDISLKELTNKQREKSKKHIKGAKRSARNSSPSTILSIQDLKTYNKLHKNIIQQIESQKLRYSLSEENPPIKVQFQHHYQNKIMRFEQYAIEQEDFFMLEYLLKYNIYTVKCKDTLKYTQNKVVLLNQICTNKNLPRHLLKQAIRYLTPEMRNEYLKSALSMQTFSCLDLTAITSHLLTHGATLNLDMAYGILAKRENTENIHLLRTATYSCLPPNGETYHRCWHICLIFELTFYEKSSLDKDLITSHFSLATSIDLLREYYCERDLSTTELNNLPLILARITNYFPNTYQDTVLYLFEKYIISDEKNFQFVLFLINTFLLEKQLDDEQISFITSWLIKKITALWDIDISEIKDNQFYIARLAYLLMLFDKKAYMNLCSRGFAKDRLDLHPAFEMNDATLPTLNMTTVDRVAPLGEPYHLSKDNQLLMNRVNQANNAPLNSSNHHHAGCKYFLFTTRPSPETTLPKRKSTEPKAEKIDTDFPRDDHEHEDKHNDQQQSSEKRRRIGN